MSVTAISLKAKIRNLARKKDMSAQVVLQTMCLNGFWHGFPNLKTRII